MKAPLQSPKSFGSAATAQRAGMKGLKTITDNRPSAIAQRKGLTETISNSPRQMAQREAVAQLVSNHQQAILPGIQHEDLLPSIMKHLSINDLSNLSMTHHAMNSYLKSDKYPAIKFRLNIIYNKAKSLLSGTGGKSLVALDSKYFLEFEGEDSVEFEEEDSVEVKKEYSLKRKYRKEGMYKRLKQDMESIKAVRKEIESVLKEAEEGGFYKIIGEHMHSQEGHLDSERTAFEQLGDIVELEKKLFDCWLISIQLKSSDKHKSRCNIM